MENDVVVAVMGLTGVGKSSFVKNVTGREDIKIGPSLDSETSEIALYEFEHTSRRYVLVDTPGFDDTFESDQVITEKILKWLESSYRSGTKLDGIIYLHSIARPRMSGSAYDNLCMFRKLCGNDCFGHVVLATTFWNTVASSDGHARVKQLEEDKIMWGRMVQAGSRVVQLNNDRESALEVLLSVSTDAKIVLQAQREMVDDGKLTQETAAAKLVASHSANIGVREREQRLEQLRVASQRKADELAQMRERLHATDQQLESEKETLAILKLEKEVPPPTFPTETKISQSRRCRCKLAGGARCTRCSVPIRKQFYREYNIAYLAAPSTDYVVDCCACSRNNGTAFLQCADCGEHCPKSGHANMEQQSAYCVVM